MFWKVTCLFKHLELIAYQNTIRLSSYWNVLHLKVNKINETGLHGFGLIRLCSFLKYKHKETGK